MDRKIRKINDITYSIDEDFVRFFVLIGSKKAAVIDSGVIGEGIISDIREITDLDLVLINTHGDGDHIAGNHKFKEYYVNKQDYDNCSMSTKNPQGIAKFIKDGDIFDLGDRILKIIDTPGHTKGSVSILDVTNRILFAGDTVQAGDIFMFGQHRDAEVFAKSLQKIIDIKDSYDIICASHSNAVLDKDYADKVLKDWEDYKAGKLEAKTTFIHSKSVKCYKGKYCGFLID